MKGTLATANLVLRFLLEVAGVIALGIAGKQLFAFGEDARNAFGGMAR